MDSIARTLWVCVAVLVLSSCSIADNFSGRAVDFNVEAEQAQQQALLLNIVRASLNRPMQFTTLSTITGTQSISTGGTLTYPFGYTARRPAATSNPDVLALNGTVTASPTFTVPVLDTQEFYQGELKPLTGQEYRFFLDEGISPAVLFYVFVEHIELAVAGTTPPVKFEFHNYVGEDFDLDRFQIVADYLLSRGMSIEEMRHSQTVGPELNPAQLHDLHDIAEVTNAGLHITPVHPGESAAPSGNAIPPNPARKPVAERAPSRYQLEKSLVTYRPCFDPPADRRAGIDPSLICGSNAATDDAEQQTSNLSRSGGFVAPELATELEQNRQAYVKKLQQSGDAATAAEIAALPALPGDQKLQLRVYMRSTEAILHHLGSITARYLYAAPDHRRVIQVKIGEPYLPFPTVPCPATGNPADSVEVAPSYHCQSLFVLTNNKPADSPLSVDYDNKSYFVASEADGGGRTMRLLDLVKQLLALHTSAKELPASNVLNIIGGSP